MGSNVNYIAYLVLTTSGGEFNTPTSTLAMPPLTYRKKKKKTPIVGLTQKIQRSSQTICCQGCNPLSGWVEVLSNIAFISIYAVNLTSRPKNKSRRNEHFGYTDAIAVIPHYPKTVLPLSPLIHYKVQPIYRLERINI